MAKTERKSERKEERRERKADERIGSSDSEGVRFPLPSHHGMHEREEKPKAP